MKFILERKEFLNESNQQDIIDLLTKKSCYLVDGLWNCDKNLNLGTDIPRHIIINKNGKLNVRFGVIKGDFTIPRNAKMVSHVRLNDLTGMPIEVHGYVSLANNNISNLIRFPKYVGGDVKLNGNIINNIIGLPDHVKGFLDLENNNITDLKGFPKKVDGLIHLDGNKITSLVGLPKKIYGNLNVGSNPISSLEGIPKDFSGDLGINNTHMRRLIGVPVNTKHVHIYDCRKLETIVDLIGHNATIADEFFPPNNITKHIKYEVIAYEPNQTRADFYTKLVVYMIKEKIPFEDYPIWPEDLLDFLEPKYRNLFNSFKSVTKYNL